MTAGPCPVLTLRGDAYERGRAHGTQARDRVRAGVAHYIGLWERNTERSRDELLELAGRFKPVIGDYDEPILREIEGIAAGAKLALSEILMLNARYEILEPIVHVKGRPTEEQSTQCKSLAKVIAERLR